MEIHIFWSGPYSISAAGALNNEGRDYGLYQIYGQHSMYGSSVLLYVGKANAQTFAKRLGQEGWEYGEDPENVQIYVGRLAGTTEPTNEQWEAQIDAAEKLLIYAHQPVHNTSNKKTIPEGQVEDHHVYNWGSHRHLFPEVSGKRYTSTFEDILEEHIYEM